MLTTVWLNFPKPNPQASLRLFCLPYAGGSSLLFRPWPNHISADVEICAVQLPGRGVRIREAPLKSMQELVPSLAEALRPFLDKPFAIFGYSLGAVIGFELARLLRQTANVSPTHLFVAGRRAPQLPSNPPLRHALPEGEFISELQRLNGTPREVLEHPELIQLMLPLLRADFGLDETYDYHSEQPLDVGLSAYGGIEDADVSRQELEGWREQTTASFELRMFPGDHFFLHTSPTLLFNAINQRLAEGATRMT
jgi:medium-chain acyl-[acyl-carrier-protein] hydrolase